MGRQGFTARLTIPEKNQSPKASVTIGNGQPQPYPMSSLLFRFRQQYPQGSLRCDLLEIDRGLYLVQASVTVEGIVLGTALAAQATIEAAEDAARERVLAMLNLSPPSVVETIKPEAPQTPPVSSPQPISSPPPTPKVAIAKPQSSTTTPTPTTPVTPPVIAAKQETITPTPPPAPTVKPVLPEVDLPSAPVTEPELPFSLQSEVYAPPDLPESDSPVYQNGTQTPLPVDVNALTTDDTESSPPPSLFDQSDSPPPRTDLRGLPIGDRPEELEEPIDFSEIIARSNLELKRLGWTSDQGRNYLLQTYGKRSRQLLSDEQLIEFLAYLEQQPTPE